MRWLHGYLRLSSSRRRLLVTGGLAVAAARVLMWPLAFTRLVWIVERTALRSARARPVDLAPDLAEQIPWAVATAARYVPRATCLAQALAAQWLFARVGCPTELRIGVAKGPDKTLAVHAWLEREGRAILGGEALDGYVPLPLSAAGVVVGAASGRASRR
jgi:hypothetical protein